MSKKQETMLHPFTKVPCEVIHLQPGETVAAGDVYRSATIAEDGSAISPESPGLGRWYHAPDCVVDSPIHPECNVHFIRLLPLVAPEAHA
jgi:hypothetical protein